MPFILVVPRINVLTEASPQKSSLNSFPRWYNDGILSLLILIKGGARGPSGDRGPCPPQGRSKDSCFVGEA